MADAVHVPVLLQESVAALAPRSGGRYLDGTVGLGGHATAIIEQSAPDGRLLGLDRDPQALALAAARLAPYGERVTLIHASFADAQSVARECGFLPLDGLLLDLGLSSLQLEQGERGFSFQANAALDMRFDPRSTEVTAAQLVNEAGEAELAEIIWRFGEEPASRRIARAIVRERPIGSTTQLAGLVDRVAGRPGRRTAAATRTFQALRIAVNRELEALATLLEASRDLLTAGGRLAVISFHSLEDRLVKQFIQRESRDCICPPGLPACTCEHRRSFAPLFKRAITPGEAERQRNPRSRSAKLRAAIRQ
jgi:16S rRNA (cytosine1402-N4)-methyltransferase